ncbi:MAG: hypothetical protein CSA72_01765 [Rhodobacterales bacterium]|nr:MAG: hypothetical protein CSA72_01765 [Rhodobacterales bacterium]
MTDLRAAFRSQAEACESLGSPFMGQLCRLLAERLEPGTALTDRLFAWQGDLTPAGESVPLRLCGALHALKLEGCAVLGPVYPPAQVSDDALWAAVDEALIIHEAQVMRFIDSAPQTNEVRRSVALIAAGHWLTARYDLPIITRELGASGGLNLHWDHYAVDTTGPRLGAPDPVLTLTPEWRGGVPTGPAPRVVDRRGVDLNPLDATDPADAQRLTAYLWPDQPARLALTRAAIGDIEHREVDRGDAVTWLAGQIAPRPGHLRMIYSTIAWQYFPADKQAEGLALIEAEGARATEDSPLAFVQMENDKTPPGAALTVRLWPGDGVPVPLARVDFHGRWIDWSAS